MIYEVLPSRYGVNVHHLRQADAIELTIGQGAKPGTGGLLLGLEGVRGDRRASATCRRASTSARPARHPDLLGPDDMIIKIEELREATDWQVPIFVKMGATRVFDDVKLAAKAGADVVVVDGMEGGTGASPEILQDHTGIPTLAADRARRAAALEDVGLYGKVQLITAGGIRSGVDVAKALALGADACYIGTAALIALNCNAPLYLEDYARARHGARRLPPLPYRPLPGRHHDPGPGADGAAAHRRGRRARRQLPDGDDARDPDDRARLRQGERPRPGPRGPARADARGGSLITGIPLVGMHAAPHIRSRTRSRTVRARPAARRPVACRDVLPARLPALRAARRLRVPLRRRDPDAAAARFRSAGRGRTTSTRARTSTAWSAPGGSIGRLPALVPGGARHPRQPRS